MKKLTLILCALMLSAAIFCGCAEKTPDNTINTNPTDEVETNITTTVETVIPSTIKPEETTETTTEAEEIVYKPITDNKVSEDIVEPDPTEKPTNPATRPTNPSANPSNPSTGDEATTSPTTPTKPADPTEDKRYKYIAFTFDDGPHYDLTYKFVDKLAEYGGVGTFYVVGNRVYGQQASALKYAYDMGNEIGVHGYTHEYYYDSCSDSRFKSELSKTAKVIKDITGEQPLTMRPIGGGITSSRVKSSGYAVINWNVDSNDWRYAASGSSGVKTIVNNVLRATDEGDIILMHEIYYNSYDAFCEIIDTLYDRGYRFVTVSQLLHLDESNKGKLYYSAD